MFSEALRILDRNMAELMVDRMKDEIVDLKEQNDELLEEYLNTKRKLEAEILANMKKGKYTTAKEIRHQEYRISYIDYLLRRI